MYVYIMNIYIDSFSFFYFEIKSYRLKRHEGDEMMTVSSLWTNYPFNAVIQCW